MIQTAVVSDISLTSDGQIVFQAVNANGAVFSPCVIPSSLGGSDGAFSTPPLKIGDRVVLGLEGNAGIGFLIGFMKHSNDALAVNCDGVASVIENEIDQAFVTGGGTQDVESDRAAFSYDEDYKGVHLMDTHIENIDSFLNLSSLHGMTLEGRPRISMQIPAFGEVRIAADGSASNQVLNAVPFMDRLFSYIGTLEQKITQLESAMNAMAPGIVAAYEASAVLADTAAPGSGQVIRDQSTQMTQSLADAAALGPLVPADTIRTEADADVNSHIKTP
jgi:outer membrane murein-binding lipoprotein Lpp